MTADDHALLEVIEADYRSNHMYWIERKLNKRFERWFRNRTSYEIKDLLAERQINDPVSYTHLTLPTILLV